jgi:large subunit ribosomal protein L19
MNARELINSLEKKQKLPEFRVGDTVRVYVKIHEGEKDRIQVFEGIVIKRRRGDRTGSFTVRKISYGVGVERVFANQSPSIEKVEVIQRGRVRRGRLFYLRGRKGKDSGVDSTLNTDRDEDTSEESKEEPEAPAKAVNVQAAAAAAS